VPQHEAWVDEFIGRAQSFRGVEGDDDDEIDALVSVCDGGLGSGVAAAAKSFGAWRY
jgi:hypothetical protein